jgi:hypothetical protein
VPSARTALVARIRQRLLAHSHPRIHILLILVASGCAAFITSVVALSAGVTSMAVRYPLAVAAGYLAFLLMIRLWIAWHRKWRPGDPFPDPGLPGTGKAAQHAEPSFGGGRSGGAGASRQWSTEDSVSLADAAEGIDLDEGWYIVVALALLASAVLALFYVVYVAPVLLAEVALDAALVAAAYQKLAPKDQRYWAESVIRRTWLPAAALMVLVMLAGFAIQQAMPEVRSIGGVFRALRQ